MLQIAMTKANDISTSTSTEEAPAEQSDAQDDQPADSEENYAEEESSNAKEEQTEAIPIEVSSEQPRGLSKIDGVHL